MVYKILLPVVANILLDLNAVLSIPDYCSLNTYVTSGPYMQFTKELSIQEFAIVGQFKGLHCCAKKYRSIEWLKDGVPYPWSSTVSQLILYPESANQTVYTKFVRKHDAGNYTCLLRNDSVVEAHSIQLNIFDSTPDDPKITYISEDLRAGLGQNLRLFCEAFAGRVVDLPDAYNAATWYKVGPNNTLIHINEGRVSQKEIHREESQIYGSYLYINDLKPEDYAAYVCKITKPGKTIEKTVHVMNEEVTIEYLEGFQIDVTKVSLILAVVLIAMVFVTLLRARIECMTRGKKKSSLPKVKTRNKLNDIFILYDVKDEYFTRNILLKTLIDDYNYKVKAKQFESTIHKFTSADDIEKLYEKNRRTIVVLSSATFNGNWTSKETCQVLEQFASLYPKLIFVTLTKCPKVTKDQEKTLDGLLRCLVNTVPFIHFDNERTDIFWMALRMELPQQEKINKCVTEITVENEKRLITFLNSNF